MDFDFVCGWAKLAKKQGEEKEGQEGNEEKTLIKQSNRDRGIQWIDDQYQTITNV